MTDTQKEIVIVCDQIKELLLEKNRKYGDSALNPIRIFSKANNLEQIKVRIDDKLNRLKNIQEDEGEDTVTDLIGYLVLYKIASGLDKKIQKATEEAQKHWSQI
jgi:ATP-dependent helicase/DNAse subunit B